MTARDPRPAPAELATLQAAVLRATLRGAPLPGGGAAPALPDRAFLPASGPWPLAAEHLAPGMVAQLGDLVRHAVPGAAAGDGDAAYLRFDPPHVDGETVWLTLQTVLADGGAGRPLGGVQVGFAHTADGGWRAVEAPRALAT